MSGKCPNQAGWFDQQHNEVRSSGTLPIDYSRTAVLAVANDMDAAALQQPN